MYEAATEPDVQSTCRCNCSIGRRTRFWPRWRAKAGFVRSRANRSSRSTFSTLRKNQHYFSKHCGVRAFGIGTETPIGKMVGVNLGCLEDLTEEELSEAPVTCIDGRNDRWQSAPEFFGHL